MTLAKKIAERLFTNGVGDIADRLVLELPGKRDGGGWCRKAAEDRIAEVLAVSMDVEAISAKVHDQWMEFKRAKGITTRTSEVGEELMVPYDQLSESAKDLDRGSVRAVLGAMSAIGKQVKL